MSAGSILFTPLNHTVFIPRGLLGDTAKRTKVLTCKVVEPRPLYVFT